MKRFLHIRRQPAVDAHLMPAVKEQNSHKAENSKADNAAAFAVVPCALRLLCRISLLYGKIGQPCHDTYDAEIKVRVPPGRSVFHQHRRKKRPCERPDSEAAVQQVHIEAAVHRIQSRYGCIQRCIQELHADANPEQQQEKAVIGLRKFYGRQQESKEEVRHEHQVSAVEAVDEQCGQQNPDNTACIDNDRKYAALCQLDSKLSDEDNHLCSRHRRKDCIHKHQDVQHRCNLQII